MQKLNTSNPLAEENQFFRFQVFQGDIDKDGKVHKTKSVGMAYLKEDQQTITVRLWMFVTERFYMILNRNDASRYLVMTREINRNPNAKNKYFWNIVGSGVIDTTQGIVQIYFDLLDKPVYISLHPEPSAASVSLPPPEFSEEAA